MISEGEICHLFIDFGKMDRMEQDTRVVNHNLVHQNPY